MSKRQYWVNISTAKKHPKRNNTHIKIIGEEKTLCGRTLNPEFDPKQAQVWKKTENPIKSKICKLCKSVSAKLGNPNDLTIKKSLQTVHRPENPIIVDTEQEEEEEDLWVSNCINNTMIELVDDAGDLMVKAQLQLDSMIEEWQNCPPQESIKLFAKMESLKQFIASCKKLHDN